MRSSWWVGPIALAFLAGGCDGADTTGQATAPDEPPELPVTLVPLETELGALTPDELRVYVEDDQLAIAEGASTPERVMPLRRGEIAASQVQGGAHGFLITPLFDALDGTPLRGADLWIDASIPYRTVAQILYTLGQQQVTALRFVALRGDEPGVLTTELPRIGRRTGADAERPTNQAAAEVERLILGDLEDEDLIEVLEEGAVSGDPAELAPTEASGDDRASAGAPTIELLCSGQLDLTIRVTDEGIAISGSSGWVAADCEAVQAEHALAVPRREGRHDQERLEACLARITEAHPEQRSVILSAEPTTPFRDVITTMGTLRGRYDRICVSAWTL